MPDRRVDEQSRRRIAELELRYRRVAHTLTIAIVLLAVVVVGALVQFWLEARAEARSRIDVLTTLCHDANRVNRGILGFVHDVAPDLYPQAERRFEVQGNCRRWAEREVER